jgi:hypothetical protein
MDVYWLTTSMGHGMRSVVSNPTASSPMSCVAWTMASVALATMIAGGIGTDNHSRLRMRKGVDRWRYEWGRRVDDDRGRCLGTVAFRGRARRTRFRGRRNEDNLWRGRTWPYKRWVARVTRVTHHGLRPRDAGRLRNYRGVLR